MAIDRAEFATVCVDKGLYCGIHPHYLLGVAQFRSGISDDTQDGLVGPFRLTQDEFDDNRTADEFNFDYDAADISEWEMQTAVFALMAHRAFDKYSAANKGANPSVLQLYLQQWPDEKSATLSDDLQKALDNTAPLLQPAAKEVPDAAPSVPPPIVSTTQATPAAKPGPMLVQLDSANQTRAKNMQIKPGFTAKLDAVAKRLVAATAKARYQAISAKTNVPWFIIAVIHEREASQNFKSNIAQGDPWNRRSTHVPIGRGPFASFEDAAFDALANCAPFAARWGDWSFGGALTLLEQYNGLGYARRGLPSPYIWASTDQYVRGKFVADHQFDPNAVDSQLGCAALLKRMALMDASIKF